MQLATSQHPPAAPLSFRLYKQKDSEPGPFPAVALNVTRNLEQLATQPRLVKRLYNVVIDAQMDIELSQTFTGFPANLWMERIGLFGDTDVEDAVARYVRHALFGMVHGQQYAHHGAAARKALAKLISVEQLARIDVYMDAVLDLTGDRFAVLIAKAIFKVVENSLNR